MHQEKPLLRLLPCGSAGNGKSTLISRMLQDCGVLPEDCTDAPKWEHSSETLPDMLRFLHGPEQTAASGANDLSFCPQKRRYTVTDVPGHAQDTRAVALNASQADAALVLIDAAHAQNDLSAQAKSHTYIASLFGVRDIIAVVNKMDLCEYSRERFESIEKAFRELVHGMPFRSVRCIPVSALHDENIRRSGERMPWHNGPCLLDALDDIASVSQKEIPAAPLETANQFSARVVWLDSPDLIPGRQYTFRSGNAECAATVTKVAYRMDMDTLTHRPAARLAPNDIGRIKVALDRAMPMAPFAENRALGSFQLVDHTTGNTLGAGMIEYALRRSHTVFWHDFALNKSAYADRNRQKPCLLWFTGYSASGKSTLADMLGKELFARGRHIYILDGDNLRHGLNRDLGFTEQDRAENVRRVSEVARLMVDAGLIVLATFISPYAEDRLAVRNRFRPGEFFEIFVDTPLELCGQRDPKGLYKRAIAGEIPNFTGISAPFEAPQNPDLHLDGTQPLQDLLQNLLCFWEHSATHKNPQS